MNRNLYSNIDFTILKEKINKEILRRGTFKWWDPLTTPSVGEDKSSPLSLPDQGERVEVTNKTYTIANPSEGSLEPTRNVSYPDQGHNPAGQLPDENLSVPNTSASQLNVDEARNFLIGLAKINDINLFYGRDEISLVAFRDPEGINKSIKDAQKSELNKPLHLSDVSSKKNDPNGGLTDRLNPDFPVTKEVEYPMEDGKYVMPAGEYDGEELLTHDGPSEENFYDDYGAEPGDSNFKPLNPFVSQRVDRSWNDQGHDRDEKPTKHEEGGVPSIRFGKGPRNPQSGDQYKSRPVMGGVLGSCNSACTGLCYQTCDNECSESCTTTCWNRCGNACTSSCGNVCTGCNTLCYTSCKTKCENSTGYSCLKSGVKAVKIYSTGGSHGEYAQNKVSYTTYTCAGCSYTCQFYPNKKTQCWDSACMGMCFNSCLTACSTSCFGGCIDNASDNKGKYKTGIGRGCSSGCTANCIGLCQGVCEGFCINTCFGTCKTSCFDNCEWSCQTCCGSGCTQGCKNGCNGCTSCTGYCKDQVTKETLCGDNGCTLTCQHDCNKNCIGIGCRSICGIESAGACEANCRLSCMATSCTALCSNACSSYCSTCANNCGFQCGACSSLCSVGCSADCNVNCTEECQHSCSINCVKSCTEACGGCSDLCYSCVGMCMGVCSIKCENGCSSCTNTCGWWCDASCNRQCFNNCDNRCISSCSGSCATFLTSNTTVPLEGPERPPTATGYIYPNPKDRWEERESFKLFRDPESPSRPPDPPPEPPKPIEIGVDKDRNLIVNLPGELGYVTKQTTLHGGVFTIDQSTGEITVNLDAIPGIIDTMHPNIDGGGAIFIVEIFYNPNYIVTPEDIGVKLPFGFEALDPILDKDNNTIIIIQRDKFLFPEEEEDPNYGKDI